MANPVNWFHISAKHAEPLAKFYGESFDWKMKPGPGGMVFVEPDKGGIPGGIAANPDGGDQHSIVIYVGCASLEAQLERIEKAGGKAFGPPMDLPPGMGRIAHFTDPVGNMVGLWEGGPQAKPTPKRRAPAKKAAPKKAAAKKGTPKKAAAKKAAPKKAKKAAKKA
jgi:predicted enzyme related to lactoylglutathione lyase